MENKKGSITTAQNKLLHAVLHETNWSHGDFSTSLGFSVSDLSMEEASILISGMRNKLAGKDEDLGDLIAIVRKMHASINTDEKKENTPDTPNIPDPIADAARMIAEAEERDRKRDDLIARNHQTAETKAIVPSSRSSSRPSSRPQLMARLNGIPEELADAFFAIIDGNLYIKHPGLLYIAGKIGYARIKVESEPDPEHQGYKARAYIYPKIPLEVIVSLSKMDLQLANRILDDYYGPTPGAGLANPTNCKSKQLPYLLEMSETRAVVRALRLYTGYGGTAWEELPEGEPMSAVEVQ